MEITEKELIQIISEEVDKMVESDEIDEGVLDRLKAQAAGATSGLKSAVAGAFGQDTTQIDATKKLKQAASVMNSYAQHMLKLRQKLETDVNKLGLGQLPDIVKVTNAIEQTRAATQEIADTAPTDERMRAYAARAIADDRAARGEEPAAAEPAAAEPAATPAAAKPAAGDVPINPRTGKPYSRSTMRRRAKKEKEKAASINPRTGKPWSKSTLRRRAKKAAGTRPAAAAQQQNESKVKKGKTLNEQLQEISKRWGFDK